MDSTPLPQLWATFSPEMRQQLAYLWTDLLHRQISDSGLHVVGEHDISANVLQSIRLQQADRKRALRNMLPPHLDWLAKNMIGADGSHLADAIASGSTVYLSLVLRKA